MNFNPIHQAGRVLRHAANELLKLASLSGTWIDVGAHHGESTLDLACRNPRLLVYAFEPNLRAASPMLGRAANFVVLPMAVAEKDGCSEFYINRYDAASSLLPMNEKSRSSWIGGDALLLEKTITVPTIRLDTFMTTAGIARVDFLKIDTQGNDLAVIRSAGRRIQDIHRITLEVDVTPNRLYEGAPSKEEVLSFLRGVGFRLVSNEQQSYQQEENLTFERSAS